MTTVPREVRVQFAPSANRTEVVRNEIFSVFPVVALVQGVIHSATSPLPELALASEFGALPTAWDGSPVVLSHPKINGTYVSANKPEILGSSTMGFLYNTKVEDNKLKSEMWINRKWAAENGQQAILDALDAGQTMEVSTGLFASVDPTIGEFEGKRYSGIWRNVMPDHLAVLPPGSTGACSVEMGCGTPRTNEGAVMTTQNNEASTGASSDNPTIKANGEGCGCSTSATAAAAAASEDPPVTQKALARFFSEFIKVFSGKSETSDPKAQTSAEASSQSAAEAVGATEAAASGSAAASTTVLSSMEELVASASPEMKAELQDLISLRDSTRTSMIDAIKANDANTFSDDELKAMSIGQLKKLSALAKVQPKVNDSSSSEGESGADFSGRGAARNNSNGEQNFTAPMLVFPRKTA